MVTGVAKQRDIACVVIMQMRDNDILDLLGSDIERSETDGDRFEDLAVAFLRHDFSKAGIDENTARVV